MAVKHVRKMAVKCVRNGPKITSKLRSYAEIVPVLAGDAVATQLIAVVYTVGVVARCVVVTGGGR